MYGAFCKILAIKILKNEKIYTEKLENSLEHCTQYTRVASSPGSLLGFLTASENLKAKRDLGTRLTLAEHP